MQVAYFQVGIVVSITLAFWLSRQPRLRRATRIHLLPWAMVAFWVVWTVQAVFTPQLLNLQLFVVSVAMVANIYYQFQLGQKQRAQARAARLDARNQALQDQVRQLVSELSDLTHRERAALVDAVEAPGAKLTLLETKQDHQQAFVKQVRGARESLCITSGWINDRAVNSSVIEEFRKALGRGVFIVLAYGYSSKHDTQHPDAATRRALSRLERLAQEASRDGKTRLVVARVPIHAKVVVRDADVTVLSSSNWLSNTAYHNAERGVVVEDGAFTQKMRRSVMELARSATL